MKLQLQKELDAAKQLIEGVHQRIVQQQRIGVVAYQHQSSGAIQRPRDQLAEPSSSPRYQLAEPFSGTRHQFGGAIQRPQAPVGGVVQRPREPNNKDQGRRCFNYYHDDVRDCPALGHGCSINEKEDHFDECCMTSNPRNGPDGQEYQCKQ